MASPLLERESAVTQLLAAVHSAKSGQGSVVLLGGEAGVGKTSVVRSFLSRLEPQVRVLAGGCDDLLAPPAMGPLCDAFRGSDSPAEKALLAGDVPLVLDELIGEFQREDVTVLAIEDLHWADDVTIDVLRYLTRRVQSFRIVLVITARPQRSDTRHPLRSLLGDLHGPFVQRLDLQPLSLDAVRSLVNGTDRDASELHALTAGNPFFLTETLATPGGSDVPVSVVDAVLSRARGLKPDCLEVLEQLSVLPTPVGLALAEALLGSRFSLLTEAEDRGMIEVHGGSIRFRHEIARRVIERSLPTLRRLALNRAVVVALLDQEAAEPATVVHHAVEACDVPTVVRLAPLAARHAAGAGSHRQALVLLETVLPHLDELEVADRAQLLDEYAWELHIAHRFADAVRAGERAVALYEELEDFSALAETLLRVARHRYLSGDTKGARTTIRSVVDRADRPRSAATVAVTETYQGMILVQTGDLVAACSVLRAARRLAAAVGRTDLVSLCLNYLGVALTDLGEPEGIRHLRESLGSALLTGDHESAARAYTNLAEVLFRHGELDALAELLDEGQQFTQEHGCWSHAYGLELHRAQLSLCRGAWADADRRLQRLHDSVPDAGMLAVYSQPVRARLLARRGELDSAEQLLADAWARSYEQQSLVGILYSAVAYAEWAWLADRSDVAREIELRLSDYPLPGGPWAIKRELSLYLSLNGVGLPADPEQQAASSDELDPYGRAVGLAASGSTASALEALRIFDFLGAVSAAKVVRRQLKRLGVRQIPDSAPGAAPADGLVLTGRQLEVLRLIAHGMTNAEIADELFVSVRTVDHHVSSILSRLGAWGRKEAVARAVALGILTTESSTSREAPDLRTLGELATAYR